MSKFKPGDIIKTVGGSIGTIREVEPNHYKIDFFGNDILLSYGTGVVDRYASLVPYSDTLLWKALNE